MSRSLLTQGSRHLPPWLILGVRRKMKVVNGSIVGLAVAFLLLGGAEAVMPTGPAQVRENGSAGLVDRENTISYRLTKDRDDGSKYLDLAGDLLQ